MTRESLQKNKTLVWEFWQRLNESRADEAADVIRSYVDAEVSWHGPHPINDLNGVDALLSEFWQPLLASFPDLHRTCEIFIGGHVHWVAAIGYFSGTFSRDWLGIPATGREMHIRFGEFSAVYRGKIVVTYIIPDLLDLIRQAGYQLVPPSLGKEGIITGPMTGDGVLLTPHDDAEGAKTLELAKVMCANLRTPQLDTFWDTERMMWYGPSGIGTTRGFAEFWDKHESPFDHAFPCYGTHFSGRHVAEVGEGNYAAWVGWPSIRAHHSGEYLGYPPTGRLVEWRLMDFYRREGNLIIENWVPVDMVHLFLTMGVDLFASLRSQVSSNPCTEVPAR